MHDVTAALKRTMLGDDAALRSSSSAGRSDVIEAIDTSAGFGDPPSPDVENESAAVTRGADAGPAPGAAASQLKSIRAPLALSASGSWKRATKSAHAALVGAVMLSPFQAVGKRLPNWSKPGHGT